MGGRKKEMERNDERGRKSDKDEHTRRGWCETSDSKVTVCERHRVVEVAVGRQMVTYTEEKRGICGNKTWGLRSRET